MAEYLFEVGQWRRKLALLQLRSGARLIFRNKTARSFAVLHISLIRLCNNGSARWRQNHEELPYVSGTPRPTPKDPHGRAIAA
jgi:hypothetical protein